MSREWKPGDVAMVRGEVGLVTAATGATDRASRYVETAGGRCLLLDEMPADARPLVVIDPEDDAQVERLADIFCARPSSGWVTEMQAALREFANPTPPKPDEPTGLGAVVEDAKGVKWVRGGHSFADPNWRRCGGDTWTEYADIAAVRVLSEGVTP